MLLCIIKFVNEDKAVALPHIYTRSRLEQFRLQRAIVFPQRNFCH